MDPEDIIDRNQDVFTTHSTFKNGVSLDELSKYMTDKGATGELRVQFSQGGRRQVIVTEHTKLRERERDEVRKILGI